MIALAADGVLATAIGAAVGVLGGMLFAWLVRRQDHRTWVMARAPELPIRALASGDDAWLTGAVRSAQPLRCPWFDVECVAFSYTIERKVRRTHRDSKGRTHTTTSWTTDHAETDAQDFDLDDGKSIRVRVDGASNEALDALGVDYETSDRRHSAKVLELGAQVSVLGVRQPDGTFASEREVDLLITRRSPDQRVRASSRSEAVLFTFAWLWPLLAVATGFAIGRGDGWREPPALLQACGLGLAMAAPFWGILTHNRLVRLRQQVRAAFRQVDVDLAVRSGLVPNLVAIVRAGAGHEADLLRDLTLLRSGEDPHAATRADAQARVVVRGVLMLHERYPQLRADVLYRDLHDRLWAVEEKLAHTRTLYNGVVEEWNGHIARFPAVLVARLSGCRQAPFFAGDDKPLPPQLTERDSRP